MARLVLWVACLGLALLALACAKPGQFEAVRDLVDAHGLAGVEPGTQFSWTLPNSHRGEFSEVKQLRATLLPEATPVTLVMGRERESGAWRVLYATRQHEGHWEPVALGPAVP